jgi:hypothetical protein
MSNISSSSIPAARSYRVQQKPPKVTASGRDTIIEGHELVGTVSGSVSFSATRYRIQPGLSIYPWLSERAKGWEMYRFEYVDYVYVPSNAVTTTPGSVYMAADYDPSDPAPSSLSALSTYETQNNGRVFEKTALTLSVREMFRTSPGKKLRCGPVAGDLSLYDAGSISIATIDCSNTDPIGQLWIYYKVRLYSPQTEATTPLPASYSMFNLSTNQGVTSTADDPIEFDEVIVDGMELGLPTNGVWTMPCGAYEVQAVVTMNDSAAEAFTCFVELKVDGASLTPGQGVDDAISSANNQRIAIPFIGYFTSDGTTTVQLNVNPEGAAGTITVRQNNTRISFRAVAGG